MKYSKNTIIIISMFSILLSTKLAFAVAIPNLSLTDVSSNVNISVTGADPNAMVRFYFPNTSTANNTSNTVTYTSIDIGQTNSNGSFNVSVGSNSYGLNGGTSVYVSVDNVNSASSLWPAPINQSTSNGSLSLSQQNVTMVIGQAVNIFPMNTSNTLTVQGNSDSSVVSAYFQSSNDTVVITGLNVGSSTVSICAGTAGCNSVSVSVQAPTQTITFSQSPVYFVLGQQVQTISIYGPGSGYSVSNPNRDILSASIEGTNLTLQGSALGQVTLSICASSWICGSLLVNIVSPGTAVPNQISTPPSANSNFSQSPQLTSFSVRSNNVMNLFFGAKSTVSISFSINQTVNNVLVKIAGQQTSVGQGTDGTYSASYILTGKEILPLPVVISYTNPSGLIGQNYLWIGDSATLPTNPTSVSSTNTIVPTSKATFTKLLTLNSIGAEVKTLQQRLKADGVYIGPITGTFGLLPKSGWGSWTINKGFAQ